MYFSYPVKIIHKDIIMIIPAKTCLQSNTEKCFIRLENILPA